MVWGLSLVFVPRQQFLNILFPTRQMSCTNDLWDHLHCKYKHKISCQTFSLLITLACLFSCGSPCSYSFLSIHYFFGPLHFQFFFSFYIQAYTDVFYVSKNKIISNLLYSSQLLCCFPSLCHFLKK